MYVTHSWTPWSVRLAHAHTYDPVAGQLTSTSVLMLTRWLFRWITHIAREAYSLSVLNIACSIVMPLIPSTWLYF